MILLISISHSRQRSIQMKASIFSFVLVLVSVFLASSADNAAEDFVQCLTFNSPNSSVSNLIYTPSNPSYSSVLNFTIQNLRYKSASTPQVIVTPVHESQIQAAVYCSKKTNLEIRVRSGGHDFEGQSYVADVPFVIIDLRYHRSITVDVESATAWVQAGATQGELYYSIALKSRTLGFPAAYSATVGLGGFISGGGYGPMLRKHGLAADNVIDARFIDVNGRILDRQSMGEDLFWAIRGGGAANFGIVVAWKVKLVEVPEKVTVFTIRKQNDTNLVHRWQYIAHKFHEDLFVRIRFSSVNSSQDGKRTLQATFGSLFLGGVNRLLPLMHKGFPELGLVKEDCIELSWIEAMLYFIADSQTGTSLDALLDRDYHPKRYRKIKSDFVKKPIPLKAIETMLDMFHKEEPGAADMVWTPFGGRMSEISESEIPYPHRAGNIFKIFKAINWFEQGTEAADKHISWMRKLHKYMAPYVSTHPREAYLNYKDLDYGFTTKGTTYQQARTWGTKYFKKNFDRLVQVKTKVDPGNFFRNEQSIPPFTQ